jgi:hypothetical protein
LGTESRGPRGAEAWMFHHNRRLSRAQYRCFGCVVWSASGHRVAARTAVPVTLKFTTSAALAIGGKITLNYPAGCFAAAPNPAANAAGSTSTGSMKATSAMTGSSIVITTAVVGIAHATAFTLTLSALTIGAATAANATGIAVQTDADTVASAGVDSGSINSQPTSVILAIPAGDRVAAKTLVHVTVAFTTTAALGINGRITLRYPSGFFATAATPANNAAGTASVASMTAFSSAPTATQIAISTRVAGIPAAAAFNFTLSGLTMGAATAGSPTGITVSTDADTVASTGAASGVIGGAPLQPSFTIQASDRVAGKKPVLATFGFTSTAGGSLGVDGVITLNYPSGFFESGAQISAVSQGITLNTAASGVSFTAVTVVFGTIASPNAVVITLTGFAMDAATAGGNVTVQTSADATPSYPPLFSGRIADFTLSASVDEPPNFQAPVTPIVISTYVGVAAATVLASGSSGTSVRVLELVQFISIHCTSLSPQQQNIVRTFQIPSFSGFAVETNDVCSICPSRCARPLAFVIPTFFLVGGTAIFTLILLVFNSFNVDQTESAAAQHRSIAEVGGISTAVRTP